MRQIIEDTKDRIPVPPEFHHRRTEVVLMTVDDEQQITPSDIDKFEDYKEDYEMYESQVDSLIELITRFTDEEGSGDIYHQVVETVINKLKKVESPDESLESVSDAWEFLARSNGNTSVFDRDFRRIALTKTPKVPCAAILRAAKFSVIYWLFFADSCVAYMDVGKGREQERKLY